MKMLSKRQVTELVLYSPQHIARLEKAGQFPKRVRLGQNRVGWLESDVLAWLQSRIDASQHFDSLFLRAGGPSERVVLFKN